MGAGKNEIARSNEINTISLMNASIIRISVIIPVYNAATFVIKAVESALQQPETAEVILVEDGSTDNSLQLCQDLAANYPKVHLFQHENGQNLGAGASRNLGMEKAIFEYIAFLDADDFYLPGRFSKTKKVFESDPGCEGVYEALGIYFENDSAKRLWETSPVADVGIVTVTQKIPPEQLFARLVEGGSGYFSLDGLTIKKTVLAKSGHMNGNLMLHQDTEFIYRVAAVARLLPGSIDEPVVVRRVHGKNRISAKRSDQQIFEDRISMLSIIFEWGKTHLSEENQMLLAQRFIKEYIRLRPIKLLFINNEKFKILKAINIIYLPFEFPKIALKSKYLIFIMGFLFRKIINSLIKIEK